MNCMKGRLTEIRSKWLKKKKRWSKFLERNSLDEEIEEDRSIRKMDRGQLNKWKNQLLDSLEHRARRKERHAGKSLKTWVKLT